MPTYIFVFFLQRHDNVRTGWLAGNDNILVLNAQQHYVFRVDRQQIFRVADVDVDPRGRILVAAGVVSGGEKIRIGHHQGFFTFRK